jgi:hypothetical protein
MPPERPATARVAPAHPLKGNVDFGGPFLRCRRDGLSVLLRGANVSPNSIFVDSLYAHI